MKRKKKCFTETRGEGEKSDVGEAAGGQCFTPVHQRFHFLFFHTDVVDCGPLLCRRLLHPLLLLLVLVVVVVVVKGI